MSSKNHLSGLKALEMIKNKEMFVYEDFILECATFLARPLLITLQYQVDGSHILVMMK